jgi:multicomponent Na+:H+ antiporter subunit F
MLAAAALALLVAMAMMIARALMGPTPFDRMLAVNSFGTKTVLFVGVAGFLAGRPDFLDIAIAYALINFVATIALLKVVRYRSLQASLSRRRPKGKGAANG